jgi:CubicO group peptidase (beta-lactamase class C family)
MTGPITRRDALLRSAALASASVMPAAPVPGIAAPSRLAAGSAEIDRALQAKVGAREIPGVVAMAANEQSVVYEGAFGFRDMAAASRMSTDAVFRIASMVKLLTSVAALQLVERGKLKLDEPAGQIDPALGSAQVLAGFDAKGVPQLRPAQQPITLRHLLTHTSGFSYLLWDPNVVRYLRVARHDPALPRMPLMFEPGSRWAYGGGLDRVGRMVEIAGGQSLDRYFGDHITGPLGMNDTGFSLNEKQRARQARLHVREANGKLVPQPFEKPAAPKVFSGGGGIYSTAPDYLTLLQALLSGGSLRGTSILRPQTVALMSANQIGDLEDNKPGAIERCGFFSGRSVKMGARSHDQPRSRPRRPQGGQPHMGRPVQYLLLDRPGDADRGRDHDADPPLRRPTRSQGLSTIRTRNLSRDCAGLRTFSIIVCGRSPSPASGRSRCHGDLDQTQVARHRMKIAVVMEQGPAVFYAPGADQQIDGLANGDAAPAQGTKMAGRSDRDRVASHGHNFEAPQEGFDFPSRPLAIKALQYLAEHQVPDDDFVGAEDRAQSLDMGRIPAVEEVYPDTAVDNDHPGPRPLRLRARSPRQRYFPKAASASRCRCSRIIKRSACSTVCFLVACPEAFWASAISASSISILVRIRRSVALCMETLYYTHSASNSRRGFSGNPVARPLIGRHAMRKPLPIGVA